MTDTPFWMLLAATGTALAMLLHIGCIAFGAPWYEFFGAGQRMVRLARAGRAEPALITAAITIVLGIWTLYALSAAGWVRPLPGTRWVLLGIIGILGGRGLAGLIIGRVRPGYNGARFWYASSLTCLALAALYVAGTLTR